MSKDAYERIRRLVAEACGVAPEQVRPDTRLGDLVRTSLHLVELTMAFEESNLDVPADAAPDVLWMTIRELADAHQRGST